MTVNFQWIELMSVARNAFPAVVRESGWPATMTPMELAAMTHHDRGTHESRQNWIDTARYIVQCCAVGSLASQRITSSGESSSVPGGKKYQIRACDFSAWLLTQKQKPNQHIQAWFDAMGVAGEGVPDATPKPKQRGKAQDETIIREIKKQGLDPQALPKNSPGKLGVKAAIRAAVDGKGLFIGSTVFDAAWERLRKCGDIVDKS